MGQALILGNRPMSQLGQSLPKCHVSVGSGLPPIATKQRTLLDFSKVP